MTLLSVWLVLLLVAFCLGFGVGLFMKPVHVVLHVTTPMWTVYNEHEDDTFEDEDEEDEDEEDDEPWPQN